MQKYKFTSDRERRGRRNLPGPGADTKLWRPFVSVTKRRERSVSVCFVPSVRDGQSCLVRRHTVSHCGRGGDSESTLGASRRREAILLRSAPSAIAGGQSPGNRTDSLTPVDRACAAEETDACYSPRVTQNSATPIKAIKLLLAITIMSWAGPACYYLVLFQTHFVLQKHIYI